MTELCHLETNETIFVDIVGSNGYWLLAKDGYSYDMRYWSKIDRP